VCGDFKLSHDPEYMCCGDIKLSHDREYMCCGDIKISHGLEYMCHGDIKLSLYLNTSFTMLPHVNIFFLVHGLCTSEQIHVISTSSSLKYAHGLLIHNI